MNGQHHVLSSLTFNLQGKTNIKKHKKTENKNKTPKLKKTTNQKIKFDKKKFKTTEV